LDIAVMALVLFFVPNPVLGLAEMKRVVKPGGIVAAYVWDVFGEGLPIQMFHKEFRKRGIQYPLPPSAEVSKMERLKELWNKADLRSVESTQIKATRKFGNFDEFWNINTTSPALSVVLEDLSTQEISEIRFSLVNQGIGLLGHLFMKMNFLCTTPLQATYQPNLSDVRFRPCAQHAT